MIKRLRFAGMLFILYYRTARQEGHGRVLAFQRALTMMLIFLFAKLLEGRS